MKPEETSKGGMENDHGERSPELRPRASGPLHSVSPERIEAEQLGDDVHPKTMNGRKGAVSLPSSSVESTPERVRKGGNGACPPEVTSSVPVAAAPEVVDASSVTSSKTGGKKKASKAKKQAQAQPQPQQPSPQQQQQQQQPQPSPTRGNKGTPAEQPATNSPQRNGKKGKGDAAAVRSPELRGKAKPVPGSPIYVPKQRPVNGDDSSTTSGRSRSPSHLRLNGPDEGSRSGRDHGANERNAEGPDAAVWSRGAAVDEHRQRVRAPPVKRERGRASPAVNTMDVSDTVSLPSPPIYPKGQTPSPRLKPSASPFSSGPPSPITPTPSSGPSANWGQPRNRGGGDWPPARNGNGKQGRKKGGGRGGPQAYPGPQGLPVEELPQGPVDLLAWDASARLREQLSYEIEDMAASLMEVANRRRPWQLCALTRLEEVISRLWPSARMEVYGE